MKPFLIPLAALAVISSLSARAADLSVTPLYKAAAAAPAVHSWTGFYLTGYGSYGVNFGGNQVGLANFSTAPHGPGAGGGIGLIYELPSSPWVIGLRGDIGYANLQGSASSPVVFANGGLSVLSISNATNYLGDVNAVFGYALGSDQKLLAYLTGGLAFGGAKPNLQVATVSQGLSDTSFGWDFGGGLAYALTPNFSIFIEGDYFQLGGKSLMFTDPTTGLPVQTSAAAYDIALQKLGLSFKLP